jgi:hypothetical protein
VRKPSGSEGGNTSDKSVMESLSEVGLSVKKLSKTEVK